jgi:hypothetical protein
MSQTTAFELLGFAGISIGVLAYVPQVLHLALEHCSAGVSSRAWAMWLTSMWGAKTRVGRSQRAHLQAKPN